jgi:zinc transport system substrate-binding protein
MINQVTVGIVAILVIIPLLSFGLWNSDSPILFEKVEGKSKIFAIASFYPLYEFTKEVGGDKVDVSLLVPQGVEPHDWEPTIKDIQKIHQADLIIINGNGFENWIDKIDSSKVSIINSGRSFGWSNSNEPTEPFDYHYWLNPISAKLQIKDITNGLIEADPENEIYYKNAKTAYDLKLDTLHLKIKAGLDGCKKDFIAFHDAFSYFAHQYDLNQHTVIQSNSPHGEPTSKKLENVLELAKILEIDTIFSEEGVDSRTSKVVANELGGQVLVLSPLEVVEDDSSYIEKMEENLSNLKEALCK